MSTKYRNSSDVPLDTIITRLRELADAVTGGSKSQEREFTMRIPAECDRDADLVIDEAAGRLSNMQAENEALRAQFKETEEKGRVLMDMCRFWKARTAEQEEEMELFTAAAVMICQQESDEWDSDRLQTYKDYAEVCGQRIAKLTPVNARAWILRQQAEAVEDFVQQMDSEGPWSYREDAMDYAVSLRQQADEAERAGGEK